MLSGLPVRLADIRRAGKALSGQIRATPLYYSPSISQMLGVPVQFKTENLQRSGSFKVRGAFFKMTTLTDAERQHGVVTASAGNHAQGVALAAQQMQLPATVVMPQGAPITKVEATENYGAEVILAGDTYDDAFSRAQEIQRSTGRTFIHGFEDPAVIAGQGTVGLELLAALPDVTTVVVPVGGGGLIAGIAVAIKAQRRDVRIIGVQATGAPAVYLARSRGEYATTDSVRTIADGIAVKRPGRVNWEIIRTLVDDVVLVDEEDIGHAILMLLEHCKLVAEGAGAVGLAALLAGKVALDRGPVCVVLSGGNIDVNILARIIERGLVSAGRYIRVATYVPDRPGALRALLSVVASAGANVVHVHHERWLSKVTIGEVEVDLALETRNQKHVQHLLEALRGQGYEVRLIPSFRQDGGR